MTLEWKQCTEVEELCHLYPIFSEAMIENNCYMNHMFISS